ncbi:MAG: hypothetical protein ACYDCL_06600 [Myxococcales bacterium]
MALAACPIDSTVPDVHFACNADGDCPTGQSCLGNLCFAPVPDGGTDAGVDAGTDAGQDGGPSLGDAGSVDAGLPVFDCALQDAGADAGLPVDSGYALAIAADLDQWAGQNANVTVTATHDGLPAAAQSVDAFALDALCQPILTTSGTTDDTGTANFKITIAAQAPPGPYVVAALLPGEASAQQTVLVSDYATPNGAVWSTAAGGTTIGGSDLALSNGYPIVVASPQPAVGPSYGVFARVLDISGGAAQFGLVFHVNPDGSALSFSADFPSDAGPTLAFSDFPSSNWIPAAPFASAAMPATVQSAHEYAMLVQVGPTAVAGMIWDTLSTVPSGFQLTGAVPAGFTSGSGIGFYSYGATTPPNVQLEELTVR